MKVLIVGRTRMGTSANRCIGGLTDAGQSVRLLDQHGDHWDTSAPFQVGQWWDVTFQPVDPANLELPHVEDVLVTAASFIGDDRDPRRTIMSLVTPWQGSDKALFGGNVKYTNAHNGYIAEGTQPDRSTWFWITDRELRFRDDGKHYDYPSKSLFGVEIPHGLSYVGEPDPPPVIPAGTLVRVSLARWWKPPNADESCPLRCFVQLSGWF
ncbi:MAG: hypothetical protein JO257_16220 [Deltaproteobacteria bacterium]|nr:hypothetical protein [Deltaproteobacteria bacterium]